MISQARFQLLIRIDKPKYERLVINKCNQARLKPLVQFTRNRKVKEVIEYQEAVLSYDKITIHANIITFNRSKKRIFASGKSVIVENGEERDEVRNVEGYFRDCSLVVGTNK